jgi:hypothetical protein
MIETLVIVCVHKRKHKLRRDVVGLVGMKCFSVGVLQYMMNIHRSRSFRMRRKIRMLS